MYLQVVNKLAEIMNCTFMKLDQKTESTTDLHKKEKENRKLRLLLIQEEKLNQRIVKYQKELSKMQAAVNIVYLCFYSYKVMHFSFYR